MRIIYLILIMLLCLSQFASADDTDIYGVSSIDVKPNVLILFDNSGSMDNNDVPSPSGNQIRMVVAKHVVAKLIYDNHDDVRFGLMKFNSQTPYSYYGAYGYYSDQAYESGYVVAPCGATKELLIGSYDPETTVFTDSDQSGYGAVGDMWSETWTPLAETLAEAGLYFAGKNSWFNGTTTSVDSPCGSFNSSCAASGTDCQDYSDDSPVQYRCQKNYIIVVTDGSPTRDNNSSLRNDDYINGIKIPAANMDGSYNYLDDTAYFLAHNDLLKIGSDPSDNDLLRMGEAGDFEDQTIATYTVGFRQNLALLENTARNGGGVYYTANNATALSDALSNIIVAIGENNEIYSSAAVPVSRANKAYAGNYVYYGLFQPLNSDNWSGNVKKYKITDNGVLLDQTGIEATHSGVILDNVRSFWSSTVDGPSVLKGGAGEKLLNDVAASVARNIYTYTDNTTDSTTDLTADINAFITTNIALTDGTYSDLTASVITAVRHEDDTWPLGSFIHSQPLVVHYDDDGDGIDDHSMIYAGANDGMLHCFDDVDGAEKWGFIPQDLLQNLDALLAPEKLQYFVDGSPVLYQYEDKKNIIIGERRGGYSYSSLDISDYDEPLFKYSIDPSILRSGGVGEYLGQSWAKPELCQMLPGDPTIDAYFMTGGYDVNQDSETPVGEDSKGRAVFAVNAQTGDLLNNFNFSHENFSSMTHSIVAGSVFENPKSTTTTRAYAGDMNGNLFAFRDDIFHANLSVALKDSFGGFYDGQEDGDWGQKVKLFSSSGKKIFYEPNILNEYFMVNFTFTGAEARGGSSVVSTRRRVGDYVFYGTGDRAHPERTNILNEFYAIKNDWQWGSESPLIVRAYVDEADGGKIKAKVDNAEIVDSDGNLNDGYKYFIIDVTDDLYQNTESDVDIRELYKTYVEDAMDHPGNRGWYLSFEEIDGSHLGEKIVSSPLIYAGVIYFTTYIPEAAGADAADDPCANPGAKGTGYLYALGYEYGEAGMNFDDDTSVNDDVEEEERIDRRKKLKVPGIPPAPVLVIHEGKPSIITGFEVNDPVYKQGMERLYWRQINR